MNGNNSDLEYTEDEGIRAFLPRAAAEGRGVRGAGGGGGGAVADESESGGFCADGVVVAFY